MSDEDADKTYIAARDWLPKEKFLRPPAQPDHALMASVYDGSFVPERTDILRGHMIANHFTDELNQRQEMNDVWNQLQQRIKLNRPNRPTPVQSDANLATVLSPRPSISEFSGPTLIETLRP